MADFFRGFHKSQPTYFDLLFVSEVSLFKQFLTKFVNNYFFKTMLSLLNLVLKVKYFIKTVAVSK